MTAMNNHESYDFKDLATPSPNSVAPVMNTSAYMMPKNLFPAPTSKQPQSLRQAKVDLSVKPSSLEGQLFDDADADA